MKKEFLFSDSIEVVMDKDDVMLYTPIYSKELGLYLYNEEEYPIKEIYLVNSKLTIHYLNGIIRQLEGTVLSITVDDKLFKRRMKTGIEGNLLKYDYDDALFYDLDVKKAYDYEKRRSITRKRSL